MATYLNAFALGFCLLISAGGAAADNRLHGIAMHGEPALPRGFTHLPYVNPGAPKGGRLTLGQIGTFDSLNPFIVRGVSPANVRGYVYESLLARSADEPFTLYGLLAETVEVPDDRSAITFHLNAAARFSDGAPVTTNDVAFSFELLKAKGRPYMRSHYGKVERVEIADGRTIRFVFKPNGDREMPLIMGLMPILPKHKIDSQKFDQTSLDAPLGSGPYLVSKVDPGHAITFTRHRAYWGRDLAVRKGLFNFDEIRIDYFRNSAAMFEAFKTGAVDYRSEGDPARWLDSYDFPAVRSGAIRKYAFDTGLPAGMTGFVLNTRHAKFADPRVRRALQYAFDAQRINEQMFHGRYIRSASFFARSALASTGKPADALEQVLLKPFPGVVRPEIMAGTWRPPSATDRAQLRANLKTAFGLLREAGYKLAGGQLVDGKTNQPFNIEFLVTSREQERLALAYGKDLKRLGIGIEVRQMEGSQYWARLGRFEFDVIQWTYGASLSPGNEQIHRWNSRYAAIERSFNYPGVKSAAVDQMIEAMLSARDRKNFEAAVRAFDRILLSGDYVVPLFHDPKQWVAARATLAFPERQPLFGVDLNTWWFKP
jgi:peptide/nickel transport system substrate-binding protein